MIRTLWVWGLAALLTAAASGCAMVAHPYDYCGPVYDDFSGNCDTLARAGSVLSPSGGASSAISEGEVIYDDAGAMPMDGEMMEEGTVIEDGTVMESGTPYQGQEMTPHLAP